jgi:hypothetical protein
MEISVVDRHCRARLAIAWAKKMPIIGGPVAIRPIAAE